MQPRLIPLVLLYKGLTSIATSRFDVVQRYGKYIIPAGTVISANITDLHYDPNVFGPDPLTFIPER